MKNSFHLGERSNSTFCRPQSPALKITPVKRRSRLPGSSWRSMLTGGPRPAKWRRQWYRRQSMSYCSFPISARLVTPLRIGKLAAEPRTLREMRADLGRGELRPAAPAARHARPWGSPADIDPRHPQAPRAGPAPARPAAEDAASRYHQGLAKLFRRTQRRIARPAGGS